MKITPKIMKELGFEHTRCSNQYWRPDLQLCFSDDPQLSFVIEHIIAKVAAMERRKVQEEIRVALGL